MAEKTYICKFYFADYQQVSYIPFDSLCEHEQRNVKQKSINAAQEYINGQREYLGYKFPGCRYDWMMEADGCAIYAYPI